MAHTCNRDAMNNCNLRNTESGHLRHVVEYTSEMFLVREHLLIDGLDIYGMLSNGDVPYICLVR